MSAKRSTRRNNDRAPRFCDGVSRRSFLRIGSLAMGGLSLPQVLRAEAASGVGSSHKAVIMVFLTGGPPHQDMVDLKMDAPVEIRGEFSPISTRIPGVQICELLPRTAAIMDRLITIRSLVGSEGRHASFQCMTGWPVANQPTGGWPSFGSAVSKLQGQVNSASPAYVCLSPKMNATGTTKHRVRRHGPYCAVHAQLQRRRRAGAGAPSRRTL